MPWFELVLALLRIIFLALAVSTGTIFLSKSLMMEKVRKTVDRKFPLVGYAFKCTFCLIGWSFISTAIYKPFLLRLLFDVEWIVFGINMLWPVNFVVSWFALWGLSTLSYEHVWPFLEKNAPKMRIQWSKYRKNEDDLPFPPIL